LRGSQIDHIHVLTTYVIHRHCKNKRGNQKKTPLSGISQNINDIKCGTKKIGDYDSRYSRRLGAGLLVVLQLLLLIVANNILKVQLVPQLRDGRPAATR